MNRASRRAARLSWAILASLSIQSVAPHAHGAEPAPKTAEQLANEAYEQHAAGKYAEAIATYLKVFEISKAGVVLFNVARIYDHKLHERTLAMEYYRRYLVAPDAEPELVQKATQRLTELKREAQEAAALPAPATVPAPLASAPPPSPAAAAPAPVPTSSPPPTAVEVDGEHQEKGGGGTLRIAGVVIGVTGVASVGTGVVLGLLAKKKNDDANAACNGGVACPDQRGVTLARDAGSLATGATVTFVAGLALVAGGITLYFAAPKRTTTAQAARLTFTPLLGATSAGMGVTGSF
jgi:tetratricopeptide (TPR) repeat protein